MFLDLNNNSVFLKPRLVNFFFNKFIAPSSKGVTDFFLIRLLVKFTSFVFISII